MEDQQRRLGASVDWSRNTFTLDPHVVKQAHTTFEKLWDDGLLYRGKRIVNYCTKHGTSFSDLEVEYQEVKSSLWTLRYPLAGSQESIEVATTRPETMLGDTAITVNPKDKRYTHLVGKLVELPLTGRQIPIVTDEAVDIQFGSGAVKVTPAHDTTDFEIAERHNLPAISVIGTDGKMTDEVPQDYRGLKAKEARDKVVEALQEQGFLVKTEDYTHSVGHCYKCGTVIEPLIIDQWLIKMKPLAQKAIAALEAKQIKIVPESKTKVLFGWLENIRDWNISRQIVWGIPIPAFFSDDGEVIVDVEADKNAVEKDGKVYHRDPDTFDTWFSSGQWPQATLRYPDSADFKRFYPTAVMETGADIIFFWVARMIMLGLYLTDEAPFRTVYLHGLLLNDSGQKMSKSKNNALSPIGFIEKYGADALRLGLVVGRSAGLNQGFAENRVMAMRNFSNKLWNVARFVLSQANNYSPTEPKPVTLADQWILHRLSEAVRQISQNLDNYRFSEAGEQVYSLLWNDFADWYLESQKSLVTSHESLAVMVYGLETILKLAHPFAPFVTEAIWQKMPWQKQNLIISAWPVGESTFANEAGEFGIIQAIITEIRNVKSELQLTSVKVLHNSKLVGDNANLISQLAGAEVADGKSGLALTCTTESVWLDLTTEQQNRRVANLKLQFETAGEYLKRLDVQLKNKQFLKSAPEEVVTDLKERHDQAQLRHHKLAAEIKALQI